MLTDVQLPAHLDPLLRYGDDDTLRSSPDGWRDYVAELGLTPSDVPSLLAVLDEWFRFETTEDSESESESKRQKLAEGLWAAPIHAWRALGQLAAIDAVAPMLAHADPLDEAMDDWSMEDWPHVFGMMGPAAIPELLAYAGDGAHREFARITAIIGLQKIVDRHPESRALVVDGVTRQLALHENAPIRNAFLAAVLVDFHAIESAEVIERAFAADVIDESSHGGWGEARERLGVEGLGLAPLKRREHWWPRYQLGLDRFDRPHDPLAPERERQKAKREKAKRKAAAKAKKRNRRAK